MNISSAYFFSITPLFSSVRICKNSFSSEVWIHNGALEQTSFNIYLCKKLRPVEVKNFKANKSENEFILTVDISALGICTTNQVYF